MEPTHWRSLEFLQAENFKDLPAAARQKLKASMLANDFSQPFYVWHDEAAGIRYCLDGKHRSLILEELAQEGYQIPELLPATYMACAGRQDAAKLVLQYSSIYAKVTEQGMMDFLESFDLSLDEVRLNIDLPEFDLMGFDTSDETSPDQTSPTAPVSLQERFLVPPFSVLDTRQGYWQERKRAWHALGMNSQETREEIEIMSASAQSPAVYELRNKMREEMGRDPSWEEILAEATARGMHLYGGASIFDPVLCEVLYTWFCPGAATIIDPFAGGSVRGIVAAKLGHRYHGIDLRADQVEANRRQAQTMDLEGVDWYQGDSTQMFEILPEEMDADFFFSCPPYHDLEQYSEDPADLSNMDYQEFMIAYRLIILQGVNRLKKDRFACFVVGDLRDKHGAYRDFVGDTVQAFKDAGMMYYNDMILLNVAGSMPMRVGRQFEVSRKVGKVHQNVLVFFKGDPKTIRDNFPVLPTAVLEELETAIPEGVEAL